MRHIVEFSDRELMALSTEDVKRYTDCYIASKGLFEPLPLPPEPIISYPDPDLVMYRVRETLYSTMEDAQIAAKLPAWMSDYKYPRRHEIKYAKKSDEVSVDVVKIYSEAVYNTFSTADLDFKKAHDAWAELNSEWQTYKTADTNIRDEINSRFLSIGTKVARYNRVEDVFNKNLTLANDDTEVAFVFLKSQFTDLNDIVVDFGNLGIESLKYSVIAALINGSLIKQGESDSLDNDDSPRDV